MTEAKKTHQAIVTLLHMQVDEQEWGQVLSVYNQLTPQILSGAPTLESSTLAKNKDARDQESCLIVSQWEDMETYQAWETSGDHRAELRPIARLAHGLRPETFRCVG